MALLSTKSGFGAAPVTLTNNLNAPGVPIVDTNSIAQTQLGGASSSFESSSERSISKFSDVYSSNPYVRSEWNDLMHNLSQDAQGLRTFLRIDEGDVLNHGVMVYLDGVEILNAYQGISLIGSYTPDAKLRQICYSRNQKGLLQHEFLHALHHQALYRCMDFETARATLELYELMPDYRKICKDEVLEAREIIASLDENDPLPHELRWLLASIHYLAIVDASEREAIATAYSEFQMPRFFAAALTGIFNALWPLLSIGDGAREASALKRDLIARRNPILREQALRKGLFGNLIT